MKFNGSKKQNEWAAKILAAANLNEKQVDALLRWAGPTLHAQGVMDAGIVIDNRQNLAKYADSLEKFYKLTPDGKRDVAENAAAAVRRNFNV